MRALVIHSAQDLRLETRELPAMGAREMRVLVAIVGICGSDLHYYQHGGFGTVRLKQPMALGHEVSGVVEAMGAEVSGFT
ncbi:MAG: L-idonate 5-dehydrogenase, partial [Pseudomonadota bacterium]